MDRWAMLVGAGMYAGRMENPPPNFWPFDLHHQSRGSILEYELKNGHCPTLNIQKREDIFDFDEPPRVYTP